MALFARICRLNFPLSLVLVPFCLPRIVTDTPAMGFPSSFATRPLIVAVWLFELNAIVNNNSKENQRGSCMHSWITGGN